MSGHRLQPKSMAWLVPHTLPVFPRWANWEQLSSGSALDRLGSQPQVPAIVTVMPSLTCLQLVNRHLCNCIDSNSKSPGNLYITSCPALPTSSHPLRTPHQPRHAVTSGRSCAGAAPPNAACCAYGDPLLADRFPAAASLSRGIRCQLHRTAVHSSPCVPHTQNRASILYAAGPCPKQRASQLGNQCHHPCLTPGQKSG